MLGNSLAGISSLTRYSVAAVAAVAIIAGMGAATRAATIYYDTNGTAPGTGTGATDWNSGNAIWTTDPTGVATPVAWPAGTGTLDGSDVVFSAGTNAPATYAINVAGGKIANSITVAEGVITLRTLGASVASRTILGGGITLNDSTSGLSPVGTFTINASTGTAGILSTIIGASQNWTNNNSSSAVGFIVNTPVFANATAGNTYTLTTTGIGSGTFSFGGILSDGTAGGKLALATTKQVILTGANTFSGGVTVNGGSVLLDQGGSLGHSTITIGSGGSLSGGTTVNATTGATGGTITDNIASDVGELISLSGSGVLNLANLNLTVLLSGTQTATEYVIANAAVGSANVTGTSFASVNLPSGWAINYTGTTAHPGDIVLVASGGAVPEPASLGVLALGAAGLMRRRR